MAERYHEPPFGPGLGCYSAAQTMLVIAALRDDEKPKDGKPQPHKGLKAQPKINNRKRLLEIAQARGATVWDVAERNT